jgi:hypothetical protein
MTVGSLTASLGERVRSSLTWLTALKLVGLTFQFGLAFLVIREFSLEGPVFSQMILLAGAGFLVNAALPKEFRQTWFVLLSLVGIGVVFGIRDGLWLVGIGLGLIGLCHLPVAWWLRVTIIVAIALGLAATRAGWMSLPFTLSVWPVLGSMFMFRLMIYLHHLKHHPTKVSPGRALAYFFMLPNVSFPLFPVVDYKTFDSAYYDQDAFTTYQAGLRYIARGLMHLVIYRFVYYYVARDPAEVTNLGDLLTYVVSTFLIYIRVSGQFHIIVGVLHLFGWRMPPANNLYYLATGFTEIWRRNNIYWKDFMMKLAYYPSFFKLRKYGGSVALIGATIIVFVLTWLLHSYQWFWIRGDFPLTATDAAFWGAIGGFMLIEMLRETRKGAAARTRVRQGWSASRAFRTVGFFLVMASLWALWDSQSLGDFLSLWAVAGRFDTPTLVVAGSILAVALLIAGWPWAVSGLRRAGDTRFLWQRQDFQTVAVCTGLLAIAQPGITNLAGPTVTRFTQSLRETKLNARDAASQHRGYYEQLNTVSAGVSGGELREENDGRPADWIPLTETAVYRELESFLGGELVPSTHVDFKGATLNVNRWGMRDKDYSRDKPAGTFRIALFGPSDVMGAGVADSEAFQAVLETRLNAELAPETGQKYEVLNFAVVSYSILQQMQMAHDRAMSFHPDMLILSYHPISEGRFAFQFLANQARFGREIPYPELKEIVDQAGVRRGMQQRDAFRRLKPYGDELVRWSLRRVADLARSKGIPVALFVRDMPMEQSEPTQPILTLAAEAGYQIIDARGVYAGKDPNTLLVATWDKHPNATGHQVIADRLYDELIRQEALRKPVP